MIRIFSKANCPFCDKAKAYLKMKGLQFEEVRVDLDLAAKEFLVAQGHRSVPQLYIGETLLVEGGYQGLAKLTEDELKGKLHAVE